MSHPDSEAQRADVLTVLDELGLGEGTAPLIEAGNKADVLAPEQVRYVQETSVRRDDVVLISALTGAGVSDLQRMMSDKLTTQSRVRSIDLPAEDGAALAWLHANGEVLDSQAEGERLRSEEHTSELQSLMRKSYAVFFLKKNKQT